ncbi:MAG TPA: hypothetical protein VHX86_10090 [Tepidisphaeraceae bacterium]|jgi:hypothetical protein|nr:hypothetical protein [Tepidisphaeraceae bacterium]
MSIDPRQLPSQEDLNDVPLHPSLQVGHFGANWGIDPAYYDLDEIQIRAIELTLQGTRDGKIAEMLSIDRKTLWRWKTRDKDYGRALDDARTQLYSAIADRYRTLVLRATGVMAKFLEDSIDNNRFRAAYALLMMAGAFKPISAPSKKEAIELPRRPMPDLPPKVG